jgi:hypothetical protein
MPAGFVAILAYLTGVAAIVFMFRQRRLSLAISWPYLLYGLGFIVPVVLADRPEFAFARVLYDKSNLLLASLASCGTVLLFLVCDYALLGKRNLSSLLERAPGCRSSLVRVVNHWSFAAAAACDIATFAILYFLAWKNGEIGAEYTFIGLENNHYTGPLGTALEALMALALLYVYALARHGRAVRRRRVFEVLLIGCLIARIIPGSRLPLVKSTILCFMLVLLILRPKIKLLATATVIGALVYASATYVGFRRINAAGSGSWFDSVFFLAGETYFGALPLMTATENLTAPTYRLGLPTAVGVYLIPRFAGDKVGWSESFYNREQFAWDRGLDVLAPVGGMPFLADSMIAYGPFFAFPIIVLTASLFISFRYASSGWRVLLALAIMSGSHQLWRESYANGIKTMIEPYILQYIVLWMATFKRLSFRRRPASSGG